jgi:DinB superfamily
MLSHLEHTVALLRRAPATFDALLRDLPHACLQQNEGGDSWNAYGIVGHLVHTEKVAWIPRLKMILQVGDKQAFPPLDRAAQLRNGNARSLPELLDEFASLRASNIAELQSFNLNEEDFARKGRHPSFGAVTLSELLATWPAHDLTHLHQLTRVMAHQYREAVGPFSKFLGVLKCTGHSSS